MRKEDDDGAIGQVAVFHVFTENTQNIENFLLLSEQVSIGFEVDQIFLPNKVPATLYDTNIQVFEDQLIPSKTYLMSNAALHIFVQHALAAEVIKEEYLNVLTRTGQKTGVSKPR
ncbi:Uncharacterized protein Fot_15150 [Forsythia ovata]|uniref:Uncharacterized protein n=1 Tax=Forsythia ovata TaxID=205694 RepID=A0ABD1W8M6_9LAMI